MKKIIIEIWVSILKKDKCIHLSILFCPRKSSSWEQHSPGIQFKQRVPRFRILIWNSCFSSIKRKTRKSLQHAGQLWDFVCPKHKDVEASGQGKHRLGREVFQGQDKWIPPVHSLLTHFPEELTEDPYAWAMHSLRSCAVYQSSEIISRHLWVSHLVYWMKMPLFLIHLLCVCFSWLYWRKNRCRRRRDAQNWTLKTIYNPTPQSLVSQASLGHVTHPQFFHWLKGWRAVIFPTH